MNWKKIDQEMRGGARLCYGVVGFWLKYPDGSSQNVNAHSARAVLRRDLVVILERRGTITVFRSKYENASEQTTG